MGLIFTGQTTRNYLAVSGQSLYSYFHSNAHKSFNQIFRHCIMTNSSFTWLTDCVWRLSSKCKINVWSHDNEIRIKKLYGVYPSARKGSRLHNYMAQGGVWLQSSWVRYAVMSQSNQITIKSTRIPRRTTPIYREKPFRAWLIHFYRNLCSNLFTCFFRKSFRKI